MQLAFVPREASPIRRQYLALKRQHPGAILFFQLGDFFETFEEDARIVAEVCEVALTSREMGRGERFPMAGVPVHAAETYIGRLVERGYHVALCQQMEDPAQAARRGSAAIVRREVTRVITPGTLVDPALLPAARANLLAAVVSEGRRTGLAYADVNTGELLCAEFAAGEADAAVRAELARIEPAECLARAAPSEPWLPPGCALTTDDSLFLDPETTLCSQFAVASSRALGVDEHPLAARAAAAIVRYIQRTNPQAVGLLQGVRLYDPAGHMLLDPTTREHLELLRSVRGRREGSLLQVLDRTRTPMGARLLADWLGRPLLDPAAIGARLDAVQALVEGDRLRADLQRALSGLPDLERLAGRAAQRLLLPREAVALARGIDGSCAVRSVLQAANARPFHSHVEALDVPAELAEAVRRTLVDEPTGAFGDGIIRPGCLPQLDELRSESTRGRQWLLDLEQRERERTGVRSLKVGYNRVFGYYLEAPIAALSQPLDYYRAQETGAATAAELLEQLGYQRRQTVANGERYILPELQDYESRQARASVLMADLEREAFEALVGQIAAQAHRLLRAGRALAEIDVLASFAEVSAAHNYVRPDITEQPVIEIVGGRHPVVERTVGWDLYVPNSVRLAVGDAGPDASPAVVVLTGPNMAGKTTYGRMALLVSLLAQVGCFVPAERARIGLVDRLFLRSGASDDIAGGQSTFMVEMLEAAAILRNATPRSLAFFDEVGRGTSTYDGMAIARAIVEYLAISPDHGCRAIFSTHYHELADVAEAHPNVANYRMDVYEADQHVTFTYRVVPGSADRSYGVHVARLAGLPPSVVGRAEEVLAELENGARRPGPKTRRRAPAQPPGADPGPLLRELAQTDVDHLTPLDALNTLARLGARARALLEAQPTPITGGNP